MPARSKIWLWTVIGLAFIGLLVFLLGPVLFASIAYPLPDNFRAPLANRAQQYGLSPNTMAALTFVESGFNMNARSCCAIGPTQFTPATARSGAKRLGVSPFSPEDLTRNADLAEWFGSYYISEGVRNYGSLHLAFVAYNGGGGAANASKRGAGFPATEAYARKIERIKEAYDAIYGEWWHGGQPVSQNTPAPAAPAAPTTEQFTVQPNVSVTNITEVPIVNLWQNLLSSPASNSNAAAGSNEPAPGDINKLWQALIPGT
jgi:hypothetical protein